MFAFAKCSKVEVIADVNNVNTTKSSTRVIYSLKDWRIFDLNYLWLFSTYKNIGYLKQRLHKVHILHHESNRRRSVYWIHGNGQLNHGPERKNVKSGAASNTIRNRGPHDPAAKVCHGQWHDISRTKKLVVRLLKERLESYSFILITYIYRMKTQFCNRILYYCGLFFDKK